MSTEIKDKLTQRFPLAIKQTHVDQIKKMVVGWELSPMRTDALYTATLGVHRAKFFQSDKEKLFNMFHLTQEEFLDSLRDISTIDLTRGVSGNPFNIFVVWTAHRVAISSLTARDKEETIIYLYKYLNYSFFTSIVNESLFKQGANEALMQYTLETLSDKSDIKLSTSWHAEIDSLVKHTRDAGSLWKKHEKTFTPDVSALNLIVYQQNNLRRKLVRLANVYYDLYNRGTKIEASSMLNSTGDKVVMREVEAVIPEMIMSVVNKAPNHDVLIDPKKVEDIAKACKVSGSKLMTVLRKFSELAAEQQASGRDSEVTGKGSRQIIVGYKRLVTEIIQSTYREAVLDERCNMSQVAVYRKARSIYTSSRITNPDILLVKRSTYALLKDILKTRREATLTAFRMAFLLYIVMLTFSE